MTSLPGRATLRLRKHHGLGNDFLILLDLEGRLSLDAAVARALCDRHRGVGADGVIRVTPGPTMELRNADGSPAETSGNGLRCLAHALVLAGVEPGPEMVIRTAAGPRRALVGPTGPDGVAEVSVDMGRAVLGPERAFEDPVRKGRLVDMGNPHVVVLVPEPDAVSLEVEGAAEESRHPGGANVEYMSVAGPDRIRIRTWERGAGETLACGSGSCAAAAAARAWGLTGDRVEVENPGGLVHVSFGGPDGGDVVLRGPSQFVCEAEVPEPVPVVP